MLQILDAESRQKMLRETDILPNIHDLDFLNSILELDRSLLSMEEVQSRLIYLLNGAVHGECDTASGFLTKNKMVAVLRDLNLDRIVDNVGEMSDERIQCLVYGSTGEKNYAFRESSKSSTSMGDVKPRSPVPSTCSCIDPDPSSKVNYCHFM